MAHDYHERLTFKQWLVKNKLPLFFLAGSLALSVAAVITVCVIANKPSEPATAPSSVVAESSSTFVGATFKVSYDKKHIEVTCSKRSEVYFYYGSDAENLDNDEYLSTEIGSSIKYEALYNGPYVVSTIIGGQKYRECLEITGNSVPMNLTSHVGDDGFTYIDISRNNARTEFLYYSYGLKVGVSSTQDFYALETYAKSAPALGNGWHTFRTIANTEDSTGTVYYQAIKIEGMKKPYIEATTSYLEVFGYNLNPSIQNLYYLKGKYTTEEEWNAYSYARVAIPANRQVLDSFESGLYTLQVKYSDSTVAYYPFEVK